MLELAEPAVYDKRYKRWNRADLPIIPDVWKHVVRQGREKQLEILCGLLNRDDVEYVINAADAGREGENIFRTLYNYANCRKPTKRLWISSMEDSAVRAGFDNLKDGAEYDNLYAAASCREHADWAVGINGSRLFSTLYNSQLSSGRVQSPTLAMLVKRDADIASFVKEPLYTPVIECGFTATGQKLKDRDEAERIRSDCDGQSAVLTSLERQKKTAAPPLLFDLTELQREANRLFGFTAQQTLEYAQALYEKKLLSYPRTGSRYLTGDMREIAGAMANFLQMMSPYEGIKAFTPDIDRLIDEKRVTDHHALIPTPEIVHADLSALPSGERDLLNLVSLRMICAAAPVHVYEEVTATFDCAGHSFISRSETVITDGWKAFERTFRETLKTDAEDNDSALPSDDAGLLPGLSEGDVFENVTVTDKVGSTTPPAHFTDNSLLYYMETAGSDDISDYEHVGLGTPATRAATIERLIKAGYAERRKRNLIATERGKNLIAILPDALTSPALTAIWEQKLAAVERGDMPEDEFMRGIVYFTSAMVRENYAPKPECAALFAQDKLDAPPPIGVCPSCGSPIRESERGFFCDNRSCGFKMWKDSKFWKAKKKKLTAKTAALLLKEGRVKLKKLHSEKTGKLYDATVLLEVAADGKAFFKLEFGK
jgi:DNA topoisomerase-3